MRPTSRDVARLRAELERLRERRALVDVRPGVSGLLLDGPGGVRLVKEGPGRGVRGMIADAERAIEQLRADGGYVCDDWAAGPRQTGTAGPCGKAWSRGEQ